VNGLLARLQGAPAVARAPASQAAAAVAPVAAAPAEAAFVAEARALLGRHERAAALATVRRAADEAGAKWPDIARLYAEMGAVSAASEALARAGGPRAAPAAARDLERARRRVGLPVSGPRCQLAPALEPELAEAIVGAARLAEAGQGAEARGAVEVALQRFAHAPGLLALS